jgi:hypothetical protein
MVFGFIPKPPTKVNVSMPFLETHDSSGLALLGASSSLSRAAKPIARLAEPQKTDTILDTKMDTKRVMTNTLK